MTDHQELFEMAESLASQGEIVDDPRVSVPLTALREASAAVRRAFSGSWQGYHSRVYYADFAVPPPGAHFSQEWGLMDAFSMGTTGDWREYPFDFVRDYILELAGNPDLTFAEDAAAKADARFSAAKSEALSIFQNELEGGADSFLENLRDQINELQVLTMSEVVDRLTPRGQIITRDTIVLGQGTQLPPHMAVKAQVRAIEHSFALCKGGSELLRKAASHLERKSKRRIRDARVGTNVFIGHGRSQAWRDLKDFIQDRLRLPWDEFNRVPVAGVTNIARLSEMLDGAAIAFLVMTAEDEQADGTMQARMNVIHEAGLFQGRLGFSRAIVLLEDGCAEFSNIAGLGQIRFPAGNISARFEDIRAVLEREGLIS